MPRQAANKIPSAIQELGGNPQFYTELFDKIRTTAPGRRAKASREDDAVIFAATMRYFWLKGRHRRPPSPPVGFQSSDDSGTAEIEAGTDSDRDPEDADAEGDETAEASAAT